MDRWLGGGLALALLMTSIPASGVTFASGELSARYWHASPSGDLFHDGGGAANDVEADLGLDGEGQLDLYARLGLPLVTYDGYITRIDYTGKADSGGSFGGAYSAGERTELSIELRHAGVMVNPLSFLDMLDAGLGLGLTGVDGEAAAGSNGDTKDALVLTGKAELRAYLPATPWLAAVSYRGSDNLQDLSVEVGYRLMALLQARAGYRRIRFDSSHFEGSVAGPFAGLSLAF
jgi:hypothetical protein